MENRITSTLDRFNKKIGPFPLSRFTSRFKNSQKGLLGFNINPSMLFKCKFYYYLLNSPKSKRKKKSKSFSKFKIPMPQQFLNNQTDQAEKKKIKPNHQTQAAAQKKRLSV